MVLKAKVASITGVTGRGRRLSLEFLLNKADIVHGIKRRSVVLQYGAGRSSLCRPHEKATRSSCTTGINRRDEPDPHHSGNRSRTRSTTWRPKVHVQVSFETPEVHRKCGCAGTLRLLEAIRILDSRTRSASTRPLPPKCTARCRKFLRRKRPLLSALSLWRGQGLCLLDHGQLPRGLRICMPPMESSSTMKARPAAKPS